MIKLGIFMVAQNEFKTINCTTAYPAQMSKNNKIFHGSGRGNIQSIKQNKTADTRC